MRHPLILLLLTALITIINYFDRTAFSYTILPIENDLGLSNAQFGTAAGAFGLGYLIVTLFAGRIVDRFGSVRIWGYSAIVWSAITMLIATATGFWSLSILLVLLGLAEGFNSPALLKTISDWIEPKYRARAISAALLGVPLASMIGAPFITMLIEQAGWQGMFLFVGSLGLIWSFFWFYFFRSQKCGPYRSEPAGPHPWRDLLTNPGYLANMFTFFTFGCTLFFVIIWLPGYLEQTYNIPAHDTGFLVMLPWLLSTIFQTIGGILIDTIYRKTHSLRKSRVFVLCLGLLAASGCFWVLAFSHTLATSILWMSLGLAFIFSINPAIYSLNADLFPKHIGTAQSLSTCSFALAGMVSPPLTGWITEASGSYQGAILFIAILPLIACIFAYHFCHKK